MGIVNYTYNRSTSGGEIIRELVNATDGQGLHFDGAAGNIDIASPPDLGTKFSMEFIIQADDWPTGEGFEYIIDFGNGGRFVLGNPNTGDFSIRSVSTNWFSFGSPVLDDLKVHHIVVTVDGTSAIAYDNGNQVGTATITSPNIDSCSDARIMSDSVGTSNFASGTIYRCRFWNKALSSTEVTDVYENATVPYSDQYASTASPLTAGTLTNGKLYRIITYVSGDDFTNIGGTNVTGNEFVTTGTTPTDWSNGSSLMQIGCMADLDLSFANPTQSLTVQDRAGAADGTASATGVTQVTPIEQLNAKAARIGTSAATPADGELVAQTLRASSGSSGADLSGATVVASVENDANAYLTIAAPNANETGIFFGSPSGEKRGRIVYTTSSNSLGLHTNNQGSARLTIDSAGLATFSNGIAFQSATTGSGTGTGYTLDSYEEGTWTPTDSSGAGLTLATPVGSYTRVGRLVYVRWNVTYPTTSDGSHAQIGGLPFEPLTDWRCSGSNAYTTSSIATAAEITSNGSNIVYRKGGTSNRITNSELTGKVLRGSMTYEV